MESNAKLTDNIFPECWKDDVRMNSLFAPFRKRSVNPLDWDSKLKFWKLLIEKWCFQNKRPVFTVSEVSATFERNGRRALCLPVVVGEILRSGEGCRLSDFERDCPSEGAPGGLGSWTGWAVSVMVKRPLQWAVGRLLTAGEEQVDVEEPIVLLSVLKSISDEMLESGSAELADLTELQQSKENARLGLLMLQRRGLAASATCGQRTLVKLEKGGSEKEVCISESERSAYVLREDEAVLRRNVEQLEEEKARLTTEAREYVRKGMRQLVCNALTESTGLKCYICGAKISEMNDLPAISNRNIDGENLSYGISTLHCYIRFFECLLHISYRLNFKQWLAKSSLRKRQAVEKCIEKRVQALDNIQSLLHRVKEAETDGQLLESYKIGVSALKKTLAEAGLTEDNVESTKADLEDVLELHGDLASALSEVGKMEVGEEEELEDELAQLLRQPAAADTDKSAQGAKGDKWDENVEKRLKTLTFEDLPCPPSHLPSSPPSKVSSKIPCPERE